MLLLSAADVSIERGERRLLQDCRSVGSVGPSMASVGCQRCWQKQLVESASGAGAIRG